MKRVKCPRCGQYVTFDETQYTAGRRLVFECVACGKRFAIVIDGMDKSDKSHAAGYIIVIGNRFCYRQEKKLKIGDNIIGRYQQGSNINTPIETSDPSIDASHCVIRVTREKAGTLRYELRDGPSNTGTFVNNEILRDRERRIITDGTLFTIGATSIILKT